ncbi:MAG TPA: MnhB domain-containing protein [Candidatus Krumholzibacteria bacterium]|nr:MnhB domain-containing protein [Candidatus Krumholzibacteria bacterium]
MIHPKDSVIVEVVTRFMVPFIQIFAFYVIFHGHYSPGGGFQGGALLAGSVLLQRVVFGKEGSQSGFASRFGIPFGVTGILLYAGTGFLAQVGGGNFLQYDHLPFGLSPVYLRNVGILLVEIGVAFAVMGTLVSIYDDLVGLQTRGPDARMHSAGPVVGKAVHFSDPLSEVRSGAVRARRLAEEKEGRDAD